MLKKLAITFSLATLVACNNLALNTTAYVDHEVLPYGFCQGTCFAVVAADDSYTLLGKQIKKKLEEALVQRGFRLTAESDATYILTFSYQTEAKDKIVAVEKRPQNWSQLLVAVCESLTEDSAPRQYVPETRTVYTSSLKLVAHERKEIPQEKAMAVWEGWSATDDDRAWDMREVDDYLIKSALRYFGASSGKHRRVVYNTYTEEQKAREGRKWM